MTLLAPDIVQAILDGRHSCEISLAKLMQPVPVELGTPNVKLQRNVVSAKSSVTMRLPLWPSRSTSPRLS